MTEKRMAKGKGGMPLFLSIKAFLKEWFALVGVLLLIAIFSLLSLARYGSSSFSPPGTGAPS